MTPASYPPSASQARELADPSERVQPIPLFAALITVAVIAAGIAYAFSAGPFGNPELGDRRTVADLMPRPKAEPPGGVNAAGAATKADGEALFASNCAACHQANGAGIPNLFPPLDGSEWVALDGRVISHILIPVGRAAGRERRGHE